MNTLRERERERQNGVKNYNKTSSETVETKNVHYVFFFSFEALKRIYS